MIGAPADTQHRPPAVWVSQLGHPAQPSLQRTTAIALPPAEPSQPTKPQGAMIDSYLIHCFWVVYWTAIGDQNSALTNLKYWQPVNTVKEPGHGESEVSVPPTALSLTSSRTSITLGLCFFSCIKQGSRLLRFLILLMLYGAVICLEWYEHHLH